MIPKAVSYPAPAYELGVEASDAFLALVDVRAELFYPGKLVTEKKRVIVRIFQ